MDDSRIFHHILLFEIGSMFASKAFVVAIFCIAATVATPFKPCDKGNPPKELRVKGCDAEPCLLYRGQDVIAEWDFTVVKDTDNLKPSVHATVVDVTVPYPLPEQNACKSLINGECPLDEGEDVTYGLKMPVLKWYPKVKLLLEFAILDNSENVQVCFKLEAQVVDK